MRARKKFRDRNGGGHAHWALGAVLIAVKSTLGAAQSVVFEDDTEIGTGSAALVFCGKGSGQASNGDSHFKIMSLQIRSELRHGLCFLKANFRMLRDPVAHGQKL